MNDSEAALWGWDKTKPVRYADVLALVDDPTKFMEQTLDHNESWAMTAPIQINNGKLVQESLTYTYHPDDYERRSLIKIEGVTRLIKAA